MANYLVFIAASDQHIEFIKENPDTLIAYIEGVQQTEDSELHHNAVLPKDWPTVEPHQFGPEVNHRNFDLYHLLLNGTDEAVKHNGSVFQTWFGQNDHTAIDLSGYNQEFAFKSHQVPELLNIVSQVTKDQIRKRYATWLRKVKGKWVWAWMVSTDECDYLFKEFQAFQDDLQKVINKKSGLIWISC